MGGWAVETTEFDRARREVASARADGVGRGLSKTFISENSIYCRDSTKRLIATTSDVLYFYRKSILCSILTAVDHALAHVLLKCRMNGERHVADVAVVRFLKHCRFLS